MPPWDVHFGIRVDLSRTNLLRTLAEIRAFANVIRDIPIPPGVRNSLHELNIMRAVRGTTGIEGAELSEDEVRNVIEADGDTPVLSGGRQREEREVRNAHALMVYIERLLQEEPNQPLTENLIWEFHRILTEGIAYPHNGPGRYRSFRVNAGDYLAPDHATVSRLMADFIAWLNDGEGRALDPIVQAVVAHFLLVSIHPFGDGNGRTSRGVESFLLYRAGVNVSGFYSLANYYYQHRAEYMEMLNHVRFVSDPDATPFVDFAATGLKEELQGVHEVIIAYVRVLAFRDFAREQLGLRGRLGTKTGERQLELITEMGKEEVPLRDLQTGRHPLAHLYRGLGAKTLSRDLNALRELELITVEGGVLRVNVEYMERFTA